MLGDALRSAGLTARALAAWAGTERLSALPARLPGLRARPITPASSALALCVAGVELAAADARRLPIEAMAAAGLVERTASGGVRARRAVLPLGEALLVCEAARWPDDSSYHLAGAIPRGPRARWLDLACGSAFAQLARPGLAAERLAAELDPAGVADARLGARLSGIAIGVVEADVGAAGERAELITCNAPIPDGGSGPLWRHTDGGFFARLFAIVPARLVAAPDSLAVIHARRDALPSTLPGEQLVVTYTPPGAEAFAVLRWRPFAAARRAEHTRLLTVERPHVDAADLDAFDPSPRA